MKSFNTYHQNGAMTNWVITRVEKEENKTFTWDKVFYKWSGFGVKPYNHDQEQFKFTNRRNKETGEYTLTD